MTPLTDFFDPPGMVIWTSATNLQSFIMIGKSRKSHQIVPTHALRISSYLLKKRPLYQHLTASEIWISVEFFKRFSFLPTIYNIFELEINHCWPDCGQVQGKAAAKRIPRDGSWRWRFCRHFRAEYLHYSANGAHSIQNQKERIFDEKLSTGFFNLSGFKTQFSL